MIQRPMVQGRERVLIERPPATRRREIDQPNMRWYIMSKPEDKPSIRIRPSSHTVPEEPSLPAIEPAIETPTRPQRTRARAPIFRAPASNLNDAAFPLHPDRIWPD